MAESPVGGQHYDFTKIESKWQKYWEENKTFKTPDQVSGRPKYYILDMFPYPSGDGLHVGHPEGYTATDILARYKRMRGFNVLHPMGWDAFGLPAEQHAIRTGTHPAKKTKENIQRFRTQIKSIGLSYDWDREINTTDPKYFKWTQWIFLKLFERGLAYEDFRAVNWCPALGTVLANEEVINGRSEVGDHPVIQKPMRQWVLKITAYAERLLQDLEGLDWPESIKEMQRHWIGRSEGAFIDFKVEGHQSSFSVFTTRPDTLFGASFCVLAPEHPLVDLISSAPQKAAVADYKATASRMSELDRISGSKQKTGVFTGAYAVNPANQERLPIYIADYVLATYGTGAVMAVPGHDGRDHEFATLFRLPIKRVLTGGHEDINEEAHCGDGVLVNSDFLNGLDKVSATRQMVAWLEKQQCGKGAITYKLRDWVFSRQRYWGEPIPLIKNERTGELKALAEHELPLLLPEIHDFSPSTDGEPTLTKAKDWINFKDQKGEHWQRESNTMPQWAGSCWYYLRFIDPHNDELPWDAEKEKYWMPVDLYVGGAEHAVMHLLYARFWHKVLYDCGLVSTAEPFQSLKNQGMILGENGEKMSKSRGNVVNPDDVIKQSGADSLRLYEMFMGPLEATKPWQTNGIVGVHRFLQRVWRILTTESSQPNQALFANAEPRENTQALHRLIKKVTEDTDGMQFNTAISAMMEFINQIYKAPLLARNSVESFIILLAPYAPHLAEELWEVYGHSQTLTYEPWPKYDEDLAKLEQITIAVSINGKVRSTIKVPADADETSIKEQVKADAVISKALTGKTVLKEIYVPGKIINFVIKG